MKPYPINLTPVVIHKRDTLSKHQFGYLSALQGGLCGCGCLAELDYFTKNAIRDEHLNPIANGGGNEIANRALFTKPCALKKNKVDARREADVRSLLKSTKKSQRPKTKIQSRGFDKTKTKRFDGRVVSR